MSSSLSVSSTDSNDDVSVLNIGTSTTVPESVVTSKTTSSSKRFRWPSMELRVVKDAHGSKRDSYPFLLDSNEQDKALIRNLLVYRPFLQKKGEQTTAWTNVVEMTFETTLPTGKKVFPKKISTDAAIKSCKKRLADYVDFIRKYRATKPTHNSGGDNELFSDNLRALEDLYDLHESFKNTTTEKKTSAADARARDRAEGDAIRDASLGLFVSSRNGGTSDEEEQQDKENDNPENPAAAASQKKNRRVSSGSSSGRFSVGEADYQTMQSVFKKYNEEKRDEKRRKMDLYERRLALEEKRADDDRAARQMQHEVMMTLIARLNDNNNK
jgi:hypothetical protein